MRTAILLLALLTPAMAAAAAPPPAAPPAKSLWIDWTALSQRAAEAQPQVRGDAVAEARSLGDRVGRLVAAGDCRGGERMALEAGDSALVRAVRDYCRS
jgi:hypothetical protein